METAGNNFSGGLLSRCLGAAAARARGGEYSIDPRIKPLSVLSIASRRASAAARGLLREKLFLSCGRPLFIGRHVKVYHPRLVSLGSGCSIGDQTLIDGLSQQGVSIGDGVTIDRFVTIRATGTLRELGVGARIGNRSSLGAFTYVGAAGGVHIGDDVMVGPLVGFYAENHEFDDMNVDLIRDQGVRRAGIRVADNCWIGSGAILLDGVKVGPGSVIGAGSVVTGDVAADTVVAGVPAKTIRRRGELE